MAALVTDKESNNFKIEEVAITFSYQVAFYRQKNTMIHIANLASDRHDCPLEHSSGSDQHRLAGCPSNLYMSVDCYHSIHNLLHSCGRVNLEAREFSQNLLFI